MLVLVHGVYSRCAEWFAPDALVTPGVSYRVIRFADMLVPIELKHARKRGEDGLMDLVRAYPQSLLRPALGSEEPAVAQGLQLPKEFYYSSPDDPHVFDNRSDGIIYGTLVTRNVREYLYVRTLGETLFSLWEMHSVQLVRWLADQADTLPPRRLDVLVDWCLTPYSHDDDAFWQATADDWRRMARGRNPVYRRISISFVRKWASNWNEERSVYVNALNERNDAFKVSALISISYCKVADPLLLKEVERVRAESEKGGDGTVMRSDSQHTETRKVPYVVWYADQAIAALKKAEESR